MTSLSMQDWASVVSAAMAAIAAIFSAITVIANIRTAREQEAIQTIRQYVKLEHRSSKGNEKIDLQLWFLMLTVQQVMRAHPKSEEWSALMVDSLRFYTDALDRWDQDPKMKNYLSLFGRSTERLARAAIKDGPHL